jgi:membrane protease YdiL (CAAX protease family)
LIWRRHASEIKGYFIGRIDASLSPRQIIFIIASIIAGRLAVEAIHPFPLSSTANLWSDCVIAPFNEEIVFRGLFLAVLLQQLPQAPCRAIAVSSLVFASAHDLMVRGVFDGGHLVSLLVLGGLLGWIFWKSGSVLFCIFCHVLWNIFSFITLVQHR